jgi:hypothetical protein
MSKIDSASQLAEIIRQQVNSFRQTSRKLSNKSRANEYSDDVRSRRQGERDIASLVAQRVQVIDPDDPQKAHKAFRIFLESVLLAEIGDELKNDPGFYQLVEKIQQDMESDIELSALIKQAATILLSGNKPSLA